MLSSPFGFPMIAAVAAQVGDLTVNMTTFWNKLLQKTPIGAKIFATMQCLHILSV
jgi:hypothetical protein